MQGPTPSSEKRQQAPPGVDTRIHWESDDEGWIGGSSSGPTQEKAKEEDDLLSEKFSELLNSSSDSYYQYKLVPISSHHSIFSYLLISEIVLMLPSFG